MVPDGDCIQGGSCLHIAMDTSLLGLNFLQLPSNLQGTYFRANLSIDDYI